MTIPEKTFATDEEGTGVTCIFLYFMSLEISRAEFQAVSILLQHWAKTLHSAFLITEPKCPIERTSAWTQLLIVQPSLIQFMHLHWEKLLWSWTANSTASGPIWWCLPLNILPLPLWNERPGMILKQKYCQATSEGN